MENETNLFANFIRILSVMESTSVNNSAMEIEDQEVDHVKRPKLRVKVKKFHAVAAWRWQTREESCGICRSAFDGTCLNCKMPGDDCPPRKYHFRHRNRPLFAIPQRKSDFLLNHFPITSVGRVHSRFPYALHHYMD